MLHIMRLWDAPQTSGGGGEVVPPPVVHQAAGGGGWAPRRLLTQQRKSKREIEPILKRLVREATAEAQPEQVAEVLAAVDATAAVGNRVAPVQRIDWRAVMARTLPELAAIEERLREIIEERERDDDEVIILMMGL